MEENKNCCEGKGCEKCIKNEGGCGMSGHCCLKKCHGMKHLVWIVLIIIAFCLGMELGELKSEARGNREYRGGMMNWGYQNAKPILGDTIPPITQDQVKPEVKQ